MSTWKGRFRRYDELKFDLEVDFLESKLDRLILVHRNIASGCSNLTLKDGSLIVNGICILLNLVWV